MDNRFKGVQTRRAGPRVPPKCVTFIVALMRCIFYTPLWGGGTTQWWVRLITYIAKFYLIRLASQSTFPKGEGCVFVSLPLPCGRYCISAGREAPPYGLCHVDAVVFYVLPFSDSRGRLSLRFVPLPLPCGRFCLSAGRKAPPYRFVRL